MWFDSEEDTLDFLLKASLQPEQSSTGTWQLVLHRALKVDHQAASFRQRSARLCNLQLAPRSQNVHDQAEAAADAVRALVSGSMTMLHSRSPAGQAQPLRQAAPAQQQHQHRQPLPQTPQVQASQVHCSLACSCNRWSLGRSAHMWAWHGFQPECHTHKADFLASVVVCLTTHQAVTLNTWDRTSQVTWMAVLAETHCCCVVS